MSLVWAGFTLSTGAGCVVGVLMTGLGMGAWVSGAGLTVWGGSGAGVGAGL